MRREDQPFELISAIILPSKNKLRDHRHFRIVWLNVPVYPENVPDY